MQAMLEDPSHRPWNNIWSSEPFRNEFSSPSTSRPTTGGSSASQDFPHPSTCATPDEVDGKTGSSSLLIGSSSLQTCGWSQANARRSLSQTAVSGNISSQPISPNPSQFPQLHSVNANAEHLSRPTLTKSYNTTSSAQAWSYLNSSFNAPMASLAYPSAPPVYPKHDKLPPPHKKDSVVNTPSPTDSRLSQPPRLGPLAGLQPPSGRSQGSSQQSIHIPTLSQAEPRQPTRPASSGHVSLPTFSSSHPASQNQRTENLALSFSHLNISNPLATPAPRNNVSLWPPSRPTSDVVVRDPFASFNRRASDLSTEYREDADEDGDMIDPLQYLEHNSVGLMTCEMEGPGQLSPRDRFPAQPAMLNGTASLNLPSSILRAPPFVPSSQRNPCSGLYPFTNGALPVCRPSPEPSSSNLRLQHLPPVPLRTSYGQPYPPYTLPSGVTLQPYLPMLAMPPNGVDPYATPPPGEHIQSMLLYEFKASPKSRRWELADIYGHIAEFAGDQHGSRFIQTNLETANSDEKERIFAEIELNIVQLMTDVFGNYVIQKFFEHGDQRHKKILASKMQGQVLALSMQMYGCRVVQKALDHVLVDQQALLVSELENNVMKCVKDQNGNHVIQKAIERCPPHVIAFIINAFRGQVCSLSIHPYGCRVIQRCLERCDMSSKAMILDEILAGEGLKGMITDQYGNYVVQHVVTRDYGRGKHQVLQIVLSGLETYSKHKFASNVVEKCLESADNRWRHAVLCKLHEMNQHQVESEKFLVSMIKDNFGNYVVQKLLDTLEQQDFTDFLELLHPALNQAKKTGCGKQVQSIEKKMHRYPTRWHCAPVYHRYPMTLQTPPFASHLASAANTPPPLTADTQSLQSSGLPSVNGDAVEGAIDRNKKAGEAMGDGGHSL